MGRSDAAPAGPHGRMQHNGTMLMGNKRTQRITVGVVVGVMVLSLALTLISTAISML